MASSGLIAENLGTLIVFILTFILVLVFLKNMTRVSFNIPPGPATIPFFGNTLSLKDNDEFLDQLLTWGKEHGSVYSVYFGTKLTVIVNGLEAIKELTCKTGLDFADREQSVSEAATNPKRIGINDTRADEEWKRQRRFAHRKLRGMGFGKVSLEPLLQAEARHAINYFKTKEGSLLDPSIAFGVTSSNVINQLVFQRRVDHGSMSGDELVNNVRDMVVADEGAILGLFPSLWPVMKYTEKWKKLFLAWENIKSFFHREIDIRQERIDNFRDEPEPNDFLDAYLIQRRTDPKNYTLEQLEMVLVDLLLAGTGPISTTMSWAVVYLVNHQHIQHKIHDEIINEIGYREVSLSHRSGLPYTQAALLEVQRLATVAPLVHRQAANDASLMGHKLPKGTALLLNLWSVHHDPEVWKDRKQFNPARFLNVDGTLAKQPDNLLPFSAGKRMCMGDQLAKMELFLFFTSMVQQIKFSLPPDHGALPSDGLVELNRNPKPFKVLVSAWSD